MQCGWNLWTQNMILSIWTEKGKNKTKRELHNIVAFVIYTTMAYILNHQNMEMHNLYLSETYFFSRVFGFDQWMCKKLQKSRN